MKLKEKISAFVEIFLLIVYLKNKILTINQNSALTIHFDKISFKLDLVSYIILIYSLPDENLLRE